MVFRLAAAESSLAPLPAALLTPLRVLTPAPVPLALQQQVMYFAIGFIIIVFVLHIFGKVRAEACAPLSRLGKQQAAFVQTSHSGLRNGIADAVRSPW